MKEQIKAPKLELSDEEIANLSDAQFKTLAIRMLTELVEYGHKMEEKVKAMQSEIKKNTQGTNNKGKEIRNQINGLEQKEERNIHPEQNVETRIQKSEERLRNLWDNFKRSNIQIIGVPKEKRNSKKLKTYLKNNEREHPQSGKGNRLPESPGSSENPKEVGPKEAHSKAHHNYITQN